ncbi:camp-specific 3'5'-cyclic phosphodiesterase isoform i [Anaeramoeba flamelloides]|uniref:Camp-specific 3'5'-cyclic phosphodiesterase isoform i n=1 Tax=Anaeramoeba flamelloides TaxID=1746091 RepID=A0AAV7ZU28_9EUKA|nr:camp-specific 3'5'-cyclic phosphodiesterase isoform i [Anaeramoeba flamelloides]
MTNNLLKTSFNVFEYSDEQLEEMAFQIFEVFHVCETLKINKEKGTKFIQEIRKQYLTTIPYHNFSHAFEVFHSLSTFLYTSDQLKKDFTSEEQAALLIAALCHDLKHPGGNNQKEIEKESDLALIYNDQSVIENYSISQTFLLVKKNEEANIFSEIAKQKQKKIRKWIIQLILATDPEFHNEQLQKIRKNKSLSFEEESHRLQVGALILLASDLGYYTRNQNVITKWRQKICEELGFEYNEKDLSFVKFSVLPLYQLVVKTVPEIRDCFQSFEQTFKLKI